MKIFEVVGKPFPKFILTEDKLPKQVKGKEISQQEMLKEIKMLYDDIAEAEIIDIRREMK